MKLKRLLDFIFLLGGEIVLLFVLEFIFVEGGNFVVLVFSSLIYFVIFLVLYYFNLNFGLIIEVIMK